MTMNMYADDPWANTDLPVVHAEEVVALIQADMLDPYEYLESLADLKALYDLDELEDPDIEAIIIALLEKVGPDYYDQNSIS